MSKDLDIANPARTQAIMNAYGLRVKKSLGQNFLTDQNVLHNIVATADIGQNDNVIEIGPGIGALTEYLARAGHHVLAFEIDDRLLPILEETLFDYDNIDIINQDILKVDLPEMIATHLEPDRPLKLVANLPYYITTPILMNVLAGSVKFENIVVMMQKEVADRLAAEPGTKAYGALTIAVQYRMAAELAMIVPRTVFVPAPNVDSAIVKLTALPPRTHVPFDEAAFFKVVKAGFAHRRKNLWNNLQSLFGKLPETKTAIQAALDQAEIDPKIRAERLTVDEFITLTDALHASELL
ncbi:16S rRNA (adenine(1518)-N(6)/adenine(1519)-N(6))-dimethyltransferase RsmA [Lactiplantibacillus mudanjiangensis]|uniref:Ribosomal RNA small subunit methyltransferase A n=1 Tax=Lactiplantibacillus mudanjiangensis TaxID=1296538 RepID=A0A660E318_9LACO|nr:16S rRNA (adenine(1518)-N(6)/adenine(1519)-N(6))-dimethyltransferase RsmA [Lactiplantibacillus mudanjiangensis]VDG21408.1 dimethyladenosine transferase [Lactobacillus plantarum JDM1] [Lactiplantibacillus mudanjiangensis]VDG26090.1 dimethyladenosine transferase [Lactobacillus plantarum JDM1] [Lactiplantibacillus mudanjiangensis]VDG29072.1 dimethyladenosine transferase [Lactobacillus plantarum JDM1] [Lactiplantibacillus mudanjiangensis]VDG31589.1 dimethyladenosine transferase [Lactobacillus pl